MDEFEQDRRNQYLQFRELLREYKNMKRTVICEYPWANEDDELRKLGHELADRIKKFKGKER